MSKSYWMKEQKGNFSNEQKDTFDESKRYIGIRLQQGVPLLDRDWNELEDIRRYEEVMLRKWYVGNGTPDDGFKISEVGPPASNDFKIKAGRCLVDGFEVINDKDMLYSQQKGVKKPLSIGTDRVDTVYLDVWIEEVKSAEDPALKNSQDVNIETCVRHKLEWRVRVDEGSKGYDEGEYHRYYDIAKIKREAGRDTILKTDIQDLRRTGLAVYLLKEAIGSHWHSKLVGRDGSPDPALSLDNAGNVGIGITSPEDTLDVNGDIRVRGADIKDAGGTARITLTDNGRLDLKRYNGEEALSIATDGKVGIGTPTPKNKLDVEGGAVIGTTYSGTHKAQANGLLVQGKVGIGTPTPKNKLDVEGGAVIGTTYSGTHKAPANGLLVQSKVGIGTTSPENKLSVEGDSFFRTHIRTHLNHSNAPGILQIGFSRGTGSAPSAVSKGDSIGFLEFAGFNGSFHQVGAWIVARAAENFTPTASGTDLAFMTHEIGSNSNFTRMTIRNNGNVFINGNVGIGTADPGTDKLDVRGRCYSSGGWQITNADYAEYFESSDGAAIPVATSVVLTNDGKVRAAKKGEMPIGIVTTNPALVGNSYKEWPKKYLRDEFGNQIMGEYKEEVIIPKKEKIKKERKKVEKKTITEVVTRTEIVLEKGKYIQKEISESIAREIEEPLFEEVDVYDATGKQVIGKHKVPVMETYEKEIDVLDENGEPVLVGSGEFVTKERPKLNPEYDESQEYVSREERPEWNCVGLLGQLPLRKGQPVAPTWIKIKDISKKVELWLVR